MKAWVIYLLLFFNVVFGLANLYFGLTGHMINLVFVAISVLGAGMMVNVLSREGWPHWSAQI